MLFPFLSVTTSQWLSGEKLTWAGSTDGALNGPRGVLQGDEFILGGTLEPGNRVDPAATFPPAFST